MEVFLVKIILMKINNLKSVNKDEFSLSDVVAIADIFKLGGVVAYPTDTIYGLGCVINDTNAINRIYKIKKRSKEKSLIILVKSYCMLKKYFYVSQRQDRILRDYWQVGKRPTTLILRPRDIVPKELINKNGGCAVRIPINSEFLIHLLRKINLPIISTSLNISGEKNIENASTIPTRMSASLDLVVNAGVVKNTASRIIDIRDVNNILTIRS